jgi:hypothetical protein
MIKVLCINGDFTNSEIEAVKNILKVGDTHLLPQEGEIYNVIGYSSWHNHSDKKESIGGYELDLPDHSQYGVKLCFKKNRFVVVDSAFTPNHIVQEGDWQGELVEVINMYTSVSFKRK